MKYFYRKIIVFLLLVFLMITARAQKVAVAADPFTGIANVGIPLHVIRNGDAMLPISLVYMGSGLKVKSADGSAGLGWNIVAGGEIRRELHDLPDDVQMDGYVNGQPRLGWLYNNNGSKIVGFNLSNDNNSSTCSDEQADVSYINSNFGDLSDTEPDVFVVNAPGLSCKLVFDKDHVLRTIPYQDLKISYELDTDWGAGYASTGRIKSFTIINDKGMKYVFSDQELCIKKSKTSADPGTIKYFKREFEQYKNEIQYNSAWKLTTIYDANDNYISISYKWTGLDYSNTRIALATGNSTTPEYPFSFQIRSNHGILDKIYYNDHEGLTLLTKNFSFKYRKPFDGGYSNSTVVDSIKGFGQAIGFSYRVKNKRVILNSVTSNTGKAYYFDYYTNRDNNIVVPDSASKSVDAWGYYNGSNASTLFPQLYINPSNASMERYRYNHPGAGAAAYAYSLTGADRYVNADSILVGMLKKIKYEHGGSTSLVYESNDYYDPTAVAVVKGGGLRLKQSIESDGITANTVRNWSYINPATGLSSGKAISIPLLAFTIPYTDGGSMEQQWQNSTVRLEESLSPEEHYIGYSHVRQSQNLAGSVLNEYSLPATQWDNTSSPDWNATIVNVARPDCTSSGLLAAEKYAYPFILNPNFDFERGLLQRSTVYNDNNEKLSETVYSYQRSGNPLGIQALKYDMNKGVMSYAKYPVLSGTTNLLVGVDKKDFDPASGQVSQTVVNTVYDSPNHKLPTLQSTTNSDGSIERSRTQYIKDYVTNGSGDQNSMAVYNLQNRNANFAVENYHQLERGGVNKTISSTLQLYKPHGTLYKPGMNVAAETLTFTSASGVTDFANSAILSGTSVHDSRYRLEKTFLSHDSKGIALSVEDRSKQILTTIIDYNLNQPVAQIGNARADEIGFNDFDTQDLNVGFELGPTTAQKSSDARTGLYSLSVGAAHYLQRQITKNPAASHYIFSVWVKAYSGANLTLSLTNSSNAVYPYNLPIGTSTGGWKYYELKVPVDNMSSVFTAKFQANADALIDDVLFYPGQAEPATFSYDQATANKLSETNTNGISAFYTYNAKGGLKAVLDQDKNIRINRISATADEMTKFSVEISTFIQTAPTYNTPILFQDMGGFAIPNEGTLYSWNFGDGSPIVNTYARYGAIYHQYKSAGTFIATVTKTSPLFGTASDTKAITFSNGSPEMVTVSSSSLGGTNGTITGAKFYKDGVFVTSFNQGQLEGGTAQIAQGVYSADVEVYGYINSSSRPQAYKRIAYVSSYLNNSFPFYDCAFRRTGSAMTKVYNMGFDLNGKKYLSLYLDREDCTLTEL